MRSSRVRMRRPRMRSVRREQRITPLSINRMVPNVLTLLALCAGMTAIRFAISGKFQYAVFTLIAAGIFDGLDGRLARLLKATSRFGAELDSLSDFISFGVAPAALLYLWTMAQWHSFGWAIVLFYAVCCALRLARFNTELAAEPPPWRANFFTGAPAPAGAGLLMLPMFVAFQFGDWIARSPYLNGVWITGVAVLMISRVPTVSLKPIRIPHHFVMPTLLGIGLLTAFFTTAPWPTLIVIGAVYLASIPLTVRASYRMRNEAATGIGPLAAPEPPPALPAATGRLPHTQAEIAPPNEWRH
jgi:CDP-diacylglycerol---serine O-phosphatidyltransferase